MLLRLNQKVQTLLKQLPELIDMACAPAWMTIDEDALKNNFRQNS